MKTALITGSETFGRYITNPTKWLALAADGKEIAGYQVHSLVLPSVVRLSSDVDDAGTTILKKAQEIGADIIISFGMASEVGGFRLERTATNWIYNQRYCSPQENNHSLDPSRPEKEEVKIDLSYLDMEKMQRLFEQVNLPFDSTISDDPGQYSCNGWIYRTMLAMQKQNVTIPYVFMHTACTEEAIGLMPDFDRANKVLIKKEDTLKALEIILQSYKS
jgi:pyrrolidone-carboxylate peptidase